jgi:hypothetical protein
MNIIKELSWSFIDVLDTFFGSDTDLMSQRVKQIMSNPKDRELYFKALGEIKKLEQEGKQGTKTITLSNDDELTLTT